MQLGTALTIVSPLSGAPFFPEAQVCCSHNLTLLYSLQHPKESATASRCQHARDSGHWREQWTAPPWLLCTRLGNDMLASRSAAVPPSSLPACATEECWGGRAVSTLRKSHHCAETVAALECGAQRAGAEGAAMAGSIEVNSSSASRVMRDKLPWFTGGAARLPCADSYSSTRLPFRTCQKQAWQ